MRKFSLAIGILAILVIVSVVKSQTQPEPPLKIVFPKDKTYVTQKTIKVIGTVSDVSIQQVNISMVGDGAISVTKGAFEATVELQAGLNEISVFPAGKEEAGAKITLFLKTGDAKGLPRGFKEYFLHAPTDRETNCQDCHKLDSTPADYRQMNIMEATCQTEGCHEDIGKEKYVHGPAAGGTCIACHNPHGSVNEYAVSRPALPLCLICHEEKEDELKQQYVHNVITTSGCIDCHDSHESPIKFQLKANTTSELCFTCHDDSKSKLRYVHGPVAADDCNACHNPHASPNEYLMPEAGNNLCFLCHETIQEELTKQNTHKPVEDDCTSCHDAHGASHAKLLNKAEDMLCFDCHEDTQQEIQAVTVKHKPVAEAKCAQCHTPHGSDYTNLLPTAAKDICFTCHKKLGKFISESKQRHGPVEESDCNACHTPHGSANPKILNKFFPAGFYNPYSVEKYALCFECHNEDIALDELTTTLTNFRNGDWNLHYLHIHKVRRGRSCKACHEAHASNQDMHIRAEVPYGKMWSYPITYTKMEQGGNCVVGCHKPKEYNRVEPVSYE